MPERECGMGEMRPAAVSSQGDRAHEDRELPIGTPDQIQIQIQNILVTQVKPGSERNAPSLGPARPPPREAGRVNIASTGMKRRSRGGGEGERGGPYEPPIAPPTATTRCPRGGVRAAAAARAAMTDCGLSVTTCI
jgi:hypothetical protein